MYEMEITYDGEYIGIMRIASENHAMNIGDILEGSGYEFTAETMGAE